jgi:hypothetical protein
MAEAHVTYNMLLLQQSYRNQQVHFSLSATFRIQGYERQQHNMRLSVHSELLKEEPESSQRD